MRLKQGQANGSAPVGLAVIDEGQTAFEQSEQQINTTTKMWQRLGIHEDIVYVLMN